MTHILLAIGLIIGSIICISLYTVTNDENTSIADMIDMIVSLPKVISKVKTEIMTMVKGV